MAVPKEGIKLEWVQIDPDTARMLLQTSKNSDQINRPLNRGQVLKLVQDMKSGNFIKTATPLKFNTKHGLIDGQHRLHAVTESGCTIEFLVASGCDDREIFVQDIGLRRSLAEMEFVVQSGAVSLTVLKLRYAVANLMLQGLRFAPRYSERQRKAFYDRHGETLTWIGDLVGGDRRFGSSAGMRIPCALLAVVARASYSHESPILERFVSQMRSGIASTEENAVILLRDELLKNDKKGGMRVREIYKNTESALMAYLQRRSPKRLRGAEQELFPLPEEVSRVIAA